MVFFDQITIALSSFTPQKPLNTYGRNSNGTPSYRHYARRNSENVHVMNYEWFPQEYMNTSFRDRIVATAGVLEVASCYENKGYKPLEGWLWHFYLFSPRK